MLDGMAFGQDPRKGFFRGNTFYHPDLKFQFAFPEGWKTANLPDRVVAQAPDGNALMQLRVGKGTPEEAAQRFFQQEGMRAGKVERGQLNGLDASVGDFATQLEDGTQVNGAAGFVAYGGLTYALIGFAAAQKGDIRGRFREVLRTFKPLTDPAMLNVQPAKVGVVRVPRDMTVKQFQSQFPSTVSVETLALINGVDGPDGVLRAGAYAKRVTGGLPASMRGTGAEPQ
jgi:predicted Zn-dependent protease